MVCQNQTLADSACGPWRSTCTAGFRRLLARGLSDDEAKRWLVERYGDFVLYRPPVKSSTWLLWFGPFGLLAAGGITWVLIARRGRGRPSHSATARSGADTAAADVAQARALLDD
jgi:cytochrome c-type biogenesis protein CcmH